MRTDIARTEAHAVWRQVHPVLGVDLMTHLWKQLDKIFLGRWKGLFSGDSSIAEWSDVWSKAFIDERISPADVKTGIDACRRKTDGWPPTLPEFLAMCRRPLDAEQAFVEAVTQMANRESDRDIWSHPAIYWAAVKIGAFDLRNATWKTIQKRWTLVLEDELAKGEWPDVQKRLTALPAPGEISVPDDVARSHLIALRAMLSGLTDKMDMTKPAARVEAVA